MAVTVGDLLATLRLDISQYQTSIQQAQALGGRFQDMLGRAFQQAQATARTALNDLGVGLDRVGLGFKTLIQTGIEPLTAVMPTAGRAVSAFVDTLNPTALALAGIAGGIAAAGGVLFEFAKHAAESAHEIELFAQRTGFGTTAIQALRAEAKLTGGELEDLNVGLRSMQHFLGQVENGAAASAQTLADLGVRLQDIAAMAPEQQFETLARAVNALPEGVQRTTAGMEVFGRGFLTLVPTMKAVAEEGVPAIIARAKELGAVLDETTLQQGAAFDRWLNSVAIRLKALATQFGAALVEMGDLLARPNQDLLPTTGNPVNRAERPELGGRSEPSERWLPAEIRAVDALREAEIKAAGDASAAWLQADGQILEAEQARHDDAIRLLQDEVVKQLETNDKMLHSMEALEVARESAIQTFYAKASAEQARFLVQFQAGAQAAAQAIQSAFALLRPQTEDTTNAISSSMARIREVLGITGDAAKTFAERFADGVTAIGKYREAIQGLQNAKLIDPENTLLVGELQTAIETLQQKMRATKTDIGLSDTAFENLAGSTREVSRATDAAAQSFETYMAAARRAREAGSDLEEQMTGHSLDTSFGRVEIAAHDATAGIQSFGEAIAAIQGEIDTFLGKVDATAEAFQAVGDATTEAGSGFSGGSSQAFQSAIVDNLKQVLAGNLQAAEELRNFYGGGQQGIEFASKPLGIFVGALLSGRGDAFDPRLLAAVKQQLAVSGFDAAALAPKTFGALPVADTPGVVPGPLGSPQLVMARGGEGFSGWPPTPGRGTSGPVTVNVTIQTPAAITSDQQLREFARQVAAIAGDAARRQN